MSDVAGRMARLSFRVDLTLPVLSQPLGKQLDGGEEVVVEAHQQVDVVGVVAAAKTVRQVVSWVHGGAKLAADGTEEAEVALIVLRGWTVVAESANGDLHRQVVANGSQQMVGDHERMP